MSNEVRSESFCLIQVESLVINKNTTIKKGGTGMKGSDLFIKALEEENVEYIFGNTAAETG